MKPIVRIAIRNVTRQKRRSLLSLFAIGFAVAVVIVVSGVLNGTQTVLQERVVLGEIGTLQVHKRGFLANVSASPLSFGIANAAHVVAQIEAVPGVAAAAARLPFLAVASAGERTLYTPVVGFDPERELAACPQRAAAWGAARLSEGAGILSPEVARQLGTHTLTLLVSDDNGVLNAAELPIAGVLGDNPLYASEKKIAFVPLALAQTVLRMPGQALEIAVRGEDGESSSALRERVVKALGPAFEVSTWQELAKFATDLLELQNAALRIVISIFVIVLLIGIINAMLMNVLAREREIGVMMALGMRRRAILTLFVSEACVLGAMGALAGAALGLSCTAVLHRVGIPLKAPGNIHADLVRPFVSARFVLSTVLSALFGSVLASLYPAHRASQQRPIMALAAT